MLVSTLTASRTASPTTPSHDPHYPTPPPAPVPPWQHLPPATLAAAISALQGAVRDLAAAKAQVKAIDAGDDRGLAAALSRLAQVLLEARSVLDRALPTARNLSSRVGADALRLVEFAGVARMIGQLPRRQSWQPKPNVPVDAMIAAIDAAARDADIASEVLSALLPGGAGVAAAESVARQS